MTNEDIICLAATAGLTIDPAFMSGVAATMTILLEQGALLMETPLPAQAEPAAAFQP